MPTHPLRCLPRAFTSKQNVPLRLELLAADVRAQLLAMYLSYQPRNSFQGLPPIKDEVCTRWVEDMVRTGFHVAAKNDDGAVIGHGALFPINQQKCEMLVVVSSSFQNSGIGTEIVRACIDVAAELGFDRIWLPVEATNVRARHVYEKCGFEYTSSRLGREVDMTCEVLRHRRAPARADGACVALPIVAPLFVSHGANSPTPVS